MVKLILSIISLCLFFGCAGVTDQDRTFRAANYKAYLEAVNKPQPVFEIKAKEGQVLKIENAESITVYAPAGNAGSGGNGNRAIQPFQEPETPVSSVTRAISYIGSRAVDVGIGVLPWYLAGKELGDVLTTAIKNAGHNTSISGSYNTDRHDLGNYRDLANSPIDQSNRSINDSYNPVDRHDVLNPPVTVIEPTVITPIITGP